MYSLSALTFSQLQHIRANSYRAIHSDTSSSLLSRRLFSSFAILIASCSLITAEALEAPVISREKYARWVVVRGVTRDGGGDGGSMTSGMDELDGVPGSSLSLSEKGKRLIKPVYDDSGEEGAVETSVCTGEDILCFGVLFKASKRVFSQ